MYENTRWRQSHVALAILPLEIAALDPVPQRCGIRVKRPGRACVPLDFLRGQVRNFGCLPPGRERSQAAGIERGLDGQDRLVLPGLLVDPGEEEGGA